MGSLIFIKKCDDFFEFKLFENILYFFNLENISYILAYNFFKIYFSNMANHIFVLFENGIPLNINMNIFFFKNYERYKNKILKFEAYFWAYKLTPLSMAYWQAVTVRLNSCALLIVPFRLAFCYFEKMNLFK